MADWSRKSLLHEGVRYVLSRGHLRATLMVGANADDHIGAITQLALPHAVWEWIRDVHTPPVVEPEPAPEAHVADPNMIEEGQLTANRFASAMCLAADAGWSVSVHSRAIAGIININVRRINVTWTFDTAAEFIDWAEDGAKK